MTTTFQDLPVARPDDVAAAFRLEGHVWQRRTTVVVAAVSGFVVGGISLFADAVPAVVGMSATLAVNHMLQMWRLDDAERLGTLRSVLGLSRRSVVVSRYRDAHLLGAALVLPYALVMGASVILGAWPDGALTGFTEIIGFWYMVFLVGTPIRLRGHAVPAVVLGMGAALVLMAATLGVMLAAQNAGLSTLLAELMGLVVTTAIVLTALPLSLRSAVAAHGRSDLR